MDSNKSVVELVSAFADGELEHADHAQVLAALRTADARGVWDAYHQIGDTLRSADMADAVRLDFTARVAARLASEPTYGAATPADACVQLVARSTGAPACDQQRWIRRFVAPGAAVAAALVLTVVVVPRMASIRIGGASQVAMVKPETVAINGGVGAVVLRDPRMEEYLLAHQRFSPSVFSTAQFARSATFATESAK